LEHPSPSSHPALNTLFEQQVQRTPDAVAVEIGATTVSYAELNAQANRLAHFLRKRGVGPGDFVGICLDRGVEMVAAIYGVLKSGAAYVPLDTEYPADRLAYMLEDSGVRVLFTDGAQAGCLALPDAEVEIVAVDDPEAFASMPADNPDLPVSEDQLIYMIYTSGSTGKPKGSLVYHRGFVNLVRWYADEFGFDADTRVLHMTSPAFDLTQKNVFSPLITGGRLCLLDQRFYDASVIVDHIERHGATVVNCTPSAFTRLFNFATDELYDRLRSLRFVVLGGEPIPIARLLSWLTSDVCQAQVVNSYGPTECTDVVSFYRVEEPERFANSSVPIGAPVPGFVLHVLDDELRPVPEGQEGQLCIAGVGVGAGYHRHPEMSAERFVENPVGDGTGTRIYLTGDRARWLPDGNLDYLGRIDTQVKVRGFRIELGEIERALEAHEAIKEAALSVYPDRSGDNKLGCYLVWEPDVETPPTSEIRAFLQQSLPDFMLPTSWVTMDRLPLTPNGKLDRKALPQPPGERPRLEAEFVAPSNACEEYLAELWLDVLGLDRVGINDRFFELGGSSLNAVDFVARLVSELGERVPIASFFESPTIRGFAQTLWDEHRDAMEQRFSELSELYPRRDADLGPIALGTAARGEDDALCIIGMAGRFPGAADTDEFWQNLLDGVEARRVASDEELREAGVPEEDIADPEYVRAYYSLDDVEGFDANFFGYQPREAEVMDPQHRLFLELAWTCLDNAGYGDTEDYPGRVGVFGGIARDAYSHHYVSRHPRYRDALGEFSVNIGNDKNFPATRVAYKFDLKGPAINIQTACSTSGVALHLASQSLRAGECDMALIGGCRVLVPTAFGFRYVQGSALSKDGRLFTFDSRGTGMVRGSGGAFLLIKRLSDARRDGDCIRAVIKSTAINNDGSAKPGFTAPSVEGQSEVIARAVQLAGVSPESIGYVEAHGTATALGDPIEVRGLTRAWRHFTDAKQFCRIGSVKTNIGHLDAGAAASGIIKTVRALETGEIPASLNFEKPNPEIDFERGPLVVNAGRSSWPEQGEDEPRRAAVSSFGLGGTNFHGILEQYSAVEDERSSGHGSRRWQLLTLSAKSEASLHANLGGLAAYAERHPEVDASDLAYSLNTFRPPFKQRAVLLIERGKTIDADSLGRARRASLDGSRTLSFVLSGAPGQAIAGGHELYREEGRYRSAIDECVTAFGAELDCDLGALLSEEAKQTPLPTGAVADALLFCRQVALARLLASWGLEPATLLAHGVGEIAAACVSGALSVADGARLVALRARALESGSREELIGFVEGLERRSFDVPVQSATTGARLSPDDLQSERYWQHQLDGTDALASAFEGLHRAGRLICLALEPGDAFIESVRALDGADDCLFVRAQRDEQDGDPNRRDDSAASLAWAVGELWLAGHAVEWLAYYAGQGVQKVPLPPFRFDRQRYWVDLPRRSSKLVTLPAGSDAEYAQNLALWTDYLSRHPDTNLSELGDKTPAAGQWRTAAVLNQPGELAEVLSAQDPRRIHGQQPLAETNTAFLFAGGGAQYVQMGRDLYSRFPVFRKVVDEGLALHQATTGYDLRRVWFPRPELEATSEVEFERPSVQLPAIFIAEVALARLWMHWGIQPDALIGHSMGENTAACLAGVLSFADALGLVTLRGQLFERVEAGGMLSVALSAKAAEAYLGDELELATVNGPEQCTLTGRQEPLEAARRRLEEDGVDCQVIPIAIAAHSRWLEPILKEFGDYLRSVELRPPTIPIVSNRTGTWLTESEATDPEYWVAHLRNTVHFADGAKTLLESPGRVFLECGPGKILGSLVKFQAPELGARVIASLRHPKETVSDISFLLDTVGRLWTAGVELDWSKFESDLPGASLHLPARPPQEAQAGLALPALAPMGAVQPAAAMPFVPSAPAPAAAAFESRVELILSKLKGIFYDMSGIPPENLDVDTTFIGMGFDSLFLTQANLRIKKAFRAKVALRQLLKDAPTLNALSEFIDGQLAPDALQDEMAPAPAAAAPTVPGAALASPIAMMPVAGGDVLQQAIAQQIQATNQLLGVLAGGAIAPPAVMPAAFAAVAPTVAPAPQPASTEDVKEAPAQTAQAMGGFKPIQKSVSGGLTEQQERYLADFMERYQARTAKSKAFAEEQRGHYADPRTVMGFKTLWKELTYTLVGERSKGSHVWDIDGNEYVDCMSGFGAIFFGHAPDFVLDAVRAQLEKTIDYGPQSQLAGPAAKLLCEMTGMERASFCNTGSEAVLAAIRMARTVTGNELIVTFQGDYHGMFDEMLVKAQQVGGERRNMPVAPGIPESASQHVLVLDYGDPRSIDIIRERGDEIAAVLIEPIQSRRLELQPKEFLQGVREATREADVPMIFDEIITGFRLHPRGAQHWFDVDVDIACYGKVIGGGIPVGVVAGKAKYMDALDGGAWQFGDDSFPEVGVTYFAGTFIRHPIAVASVHAVLNHMKAQGPALQAGVNAKTGRFCEELNRSFRQRAIPMELSYAGSIFFPRWYGDPDHQGLYDHHLRYFGAHHVWGGRPGFLTTAHSDEDIAFVADAFVEAGEAMQEGGFLPRPEDLPIEQQPFTAVQSELWLGIKMGDNAGAAYNEQVMFELDRSIDPEVFALAMDKVTNRHPSLRGVVGEDEESLTILPYMAPTWTYHDLSELSEDERNARVQALAQANIDEPFDFRRGPLLRGLVLETGPETSVICVCVSHLVCDGLSLEIVSEDIAAFYTGIEEGRWMARRPVPALSEHAAALSELEASGEVQEARDYWMSIYGQSVPPDLDLPLDRPRPRVRRYRGGRLNYYLDPAINEPMRVYARECGCTSFVLMLTAYELMLSRLSGQDDITVGVPAAGQPYVGISNLVTHAVSFLPVRAQIDNTSSFKELMLKVNEAFLDAKDHQAFAYGEILKELTLPRDPSRLPLVTASFNMDMAYNPLDFGGVRARFVPAPRGLSKYDLLFTLTDEGEQILLEVDRNSDIFDTATINRWVGHYQTLLKEVLRNPDRPTREIPIMEASERRQVLADWNDTARAYPLESTTLQGLVEASVDRNPERVALVDGEREWTFEELDERANKLAHWLREQGVEADQCVGVMMERSVDMVLALYAIVKAGGAYLPLDPEYPAERVHYILDESGARCALTQEALRGALEGPDGTRRVLALDSDWEQVAACEASRPDNTTRPDHLAYVIYTSGSTGNPKGVMIEHRGICNRLLWMQDDLGLRSSDRVLQKTPYTFDVSVWEFFLPLMAGATLVVAKPGGHKDSEYLVDVLREQKITYMHFVPSMLHVFLSNPRADRCTDLQRVICSGEALSRDLQDRFFGRFPNAELQNLYGPTEASVDVTAWRCDPADPSESVPIGRPVANTQIYILDASLEPVPPGVAGELYIGGVQVARGYLARPDLTEERFLPDPFSDEPGATLYHTGDLARLRADGVIEYLGRNDFQVKIRGLRIELGEIEAAIDTFQGVERAVVLAREDRAHDQRLVAYIVTQGGESLDVTALRNHLKANLPDYMVPQHFMFLDALPLTTSGKVDRKALPAPTVEVAKEEIEAPSSDVEKRLLELWKETLDVAELGVTQNFFELGGHSLLGMQMFARIRDEFGVDLPFTQLFEQPTIRQLASTLDQAQGASQTPRSPILPRPEGSTPIASNQQQRLWYLEQIEPDSFAYNLPAAFRLIGELDVEAARRAFETIGQRQEVLRTSFRVEGGKLLQHVNERLEFDVGPVPLSDYGVDDLAGLVEVLHQKSAEPFDIERGPLFTAKLIELGENEHLLSFLIHNLVFDGWSFDILLHEFCTLYNAYRRGQESPLPDLPVQYLDYAVWQRDWLQGDHMKSGLEYWKTQLGGELPVLDLPLDKERPPRQPHRARGVPFYLDDPVVVRLEEMATERGSTLFMVMLGLYGLLLHRYSRQDDILIGSPISGRNHAECNSLMGSFINRLVFRLRIDPKLSFGDWLQEVRRMSLEAYRHQDTPFEELVKALDLRRDAARAPIVQTMFMYQDIRNRDDELDGIERRQVNIDRSGAQSDLDAWVKREARGMTGGLEYPIALFEHASVQTFASALVEMAQQVAGNPNVSIAELASATAEERARIDDWNRTTAEFGEAETFLLDFAQSVDAHGDKTAVVFRNQTLSYTELDARSNQLARRLQSQGVGRGALVAVQLERSLHLPVSLLGIWKAGAAYVPIDPRYPSKRRLAILEACGAKLVVTDAAGEAELADWDGSFIRLDEESLAAFDDASLEIQSSGADLAYVIFTSGSTGAPKGVQVPHRAVHNFLHAMRNEPGLTEADRLLAVTTLSFDISVLEIFGPLLAGSTVVVASRDETEDGRRLIALLGEHEINLMQATPSTWRMMLREGWEGSPELRAFCGGEALPADLASDLVGRVGELWNLYGPTETTVWSTSQKMTDAEAPILIGKPLANTQCLVLDDAANPLPVGAFGELYIAGKGLATGYLGMPEETEARFVEAPNGNGGRMYRTGDLVRWTASGRLEYRRRLDDQVKVRGFRVELGEIEHALRRDERIADCVVSVRDYGSADRRLVAHVCYAAGHSMTNSELRRLLRDQLPPFMVPQHFEELTEIPLTPNGKVDRRALEMSGRGPGGMVAQVAAPATETEKTLVRIWSRVLDTNGIGRESRFFDVGGHSLLALEVIQLMEEQLGVRVHPQDMWMNNVEQLAARIDQLQGPKPAPAKAHPRPQEATRSEQGGGIRGWMKRLRS
jgi:amino acid adenylation domain-containing protein